MSPTEPPLGDVGNLAKRDLNIWIACIVLYDDRHVHISQGEKVWMGLRSSQRSTEQVTVAMMKLVELVEQLVAIIFDAHALPIRSGLNSFI